MGCPSSGSARTRGCRCRGGRRRGGRFERRCWLIERLRRRRAYCFFHLRKGAGGDRYVEGYAFMRALHTSQTYVLALTGTCQ